jgi:magnesium-transporting ATPase (P-type)
MTASQEELLQKLETNLQPGLTTDQATQRREREGSFNVVRPPVDCPSWVCCLLPCIKHVPSMKAFAQVKPDDAEVLRNGKWIRYDATSLVKGDIIRLEEGDVVPADCVVLQVGDDENEEEMLVELRTITGDDRLRSIGSTNNDVATTLLYMGGKVVQGSGTAVITAIGPNTLLAKLIREKRFPPKEPVIEVEDTGIALRTLS